MIINIQILIDIRFESLWLILNSIFCIYNYKLSYEGDYTDFDKQFTIKWDDPAYNINWPIKNPILGARDNFVAGTSLEKTGAKTHKNVQ